MRSLSLYGMLMFVLSSICFASDLDDKLLEAAKRSDLERIRSVIRQGANVNAAHQYSGARALHYAAAAGSAQVIELLLDAGADVNVTGNDDLPPVAWAVNAGMTENVARLLKAGAGVSYIDQAARRPLEILAVRWRDGEVKREAFTAIAVLLIDAGVHVHDGFLFAAIEADDPSLLVSSIRAGADVNAWSEDGEQTPLARAVLSRNQEMAGVLLGNGADATVEVIVPTSTLFSAGLVYRALELGEEEMADLLILHGGDQGERRFYRLQTLLSALDRGDFDTAESIVDRGGSLVNDSSHFLLRYAYGTAEVREFIRRHGPSGIGEGRLNALDRYLAGGIEIDERTGDPSLDFPLATTYLHDAKSPYRYRVDKAFDGDWGTSWVEDVEGSGIGQKIAFDLVGRVSAIAIVPGYGEEKLFKQNNRVKRAFLHYYAPHGVAAQWAPLSLYCELLDTQELRFEDSLSSQEFAINPPENCIAVLEIADVYPTAKWDDTCIAEIQLFDDLG